MVRFIILFLFVSFFQQASSQKIIISGKEGNRPLKWSDFTGTPDDNSSYFANTYWKTGFSYTNVKPDGDVATLENFQFNLELDPQRSWVKEGKQTDDLLKHEQGHFNIALLCRKEVLQKMTNAKFSKTNVQSEVRAFMNEMQKKYHEMNVQYDKETAHSLNKEEQARWNSFFEKEL